VTDAKDAGRGEAGSQPEAAAAEISRSAWIDLCAQQLSILRPSIAHSEAKTMATRIWGNSGHLGPMTAAALLDRMLDRRDG
jgi:hypothetical protein